MEGALLYWWLFLCAAAALNISLWILVFRGRKDLDPTRRTLLWLSAVYVLGCAFRSVLPMIDVPRLCLHDTPVSRIVLGRMVATAAELCFALQWTLLLNEAGARRAARAIAVLLVAAEGFSWAAVLTQNNLWHAVENSLWTLSAAVAALGLGALWRDFGATGRRVIVAVLVGAAGYIAFMVSYDVPMYLGRWQAGIPSNFQYLEVRAGLDQILARCIVVREWARWWQDAVWLSLYFTVAVWISIALPRAPALGRTAATSARQP
jgi:hypothetical protein